MLTGYGATVGLRLIRNGQVTTGLRHVVVPVNYWRTIEFRLALKHGDFRPGQQVLDIGSPKLLPLHIAEKLGATVYATDLDDYFVEELESFRDICGIPEDRLVAEVQDARNLTYENDSFDRIVSISVLEHIGETDVEAGREIGRVLRPGGIAVITVPFAPEGGDVYKPVEDFYWAPEPNENGEAFFEHHYTEEELQERLIGPSGLDVELLGYIGERFEIGGDSPFYERLPRPVRPFEPVISKVMHRGPVPDWRTVKSPSAAIFVLRKPSA